MGPTVSAAQLVARCRDGDQEAWAALVERFSRYVYAIVRSGETIVRSAAAAETGERIDVEVSDGRFGARVE